MLPPVILNGSELLALIVGMELGCVVLVALALTLMVVHAVKSTPAPITASILSPLTAFSLA